MSSLTSSTRDPRSPQAALHSTTDLPRLPHGVELINDDCISAMRRLPDSSRGWVLPTDGAGAVVRSAMELAMGDRLTLSFHDGIVGAVINNTPKEDK